MRSRATSRRRLTGVPGGTSAIRPPPEATICSARAKFILGVGRSTPEPSTAHVSPPAASALSWATVSMPVASPETTARPAATALLAAASATVRPKCVGWRVPTIATAAVGGDCAAHPQSLRRGWNRAQVGRVAGHVDPYGFRGEQPADGSVRSASSRSPHSGRWGALTSRWSPSPAPRTTRAQVLRQSSQAPVQVPDDARLWGVKR